MVADLFLSDTELERIVLLEAIQQTDWVMLTGAQKLTRMQQHGLGPIKLNLNQVASRMGQNYGRTHHTYGELLRLLEQLPGDSREQHDLLARSAMQARGVLVRNTTAYQLLLLLLSGTKKTFDDFIEQQQVTRATVMRRVQSLARFARLMKVRISYKKMTVVGDEVRIRLFFVYAFWIATNGAWWPFERFDQAKVLANQKQILNAFNLSGGNRASQEVGLYYLVVAAYRVASRHSMSQNPALAVLQYPVPNLTHELQLSASPIPLPPLSRSEALAESNGIYLMINVTPEAFSPETGNHHELILRYQRYNNVVLELVETFLTQLPVDAFSPEQLSEPRREWLIAHLVPATVSVLAFGEDVTGMMRRWQEPVKAHQLESHQLYRKISATLENVLTRLGDPVLRQAQEALSQVYYANLLPVVQNIAPQTTVTVALLLEQTGINYVELVTFLQTIPFVRLTNDYHHADLVIQPTGVPLAVDAHTLQYPWSMLAADEQYGDLTVVLRRLWHQAMQTSLA